MADTITQEELIKALHLFKGVYNIDNAHRAAGVIFRAAVRERGPKYVTGALYQDANGRMLLRLNGNPYYWRHILPDGRDEYRADGFAERPLRRYVPESHPPKAWSVGDRVSPITGEEIEDETNIVRSAN